MIFICILLFSGCCFVNVGSHVVEFWCEIQNLTRFVSFISYALKPLVVSLICTVSSGINFIRRAPAKRGGWLEMLDVDYAARRLRCLSGRKLNTPAVTFLILSMVWAMINISLQVVNLVRSPKWSDSHDLNSSHSQSEISIEEGGNHLVGLLKNLLGVFIAVIGLPMYTFFWYYVLVMRNGLAAELNLVLVFIKRNEGQLDWCRRRIAEIHYEFGVLRQVVAWLMPFIVASGVLGITVHITWNYTIYSQSQKDVANDNLLINILIFSEKFMLLVVPLLAVGGLNIDHTWLQFTYALSRQRSKDHEEFWDRVLRFTAELEPGRNHVDVTLFLTVISLYLGRNLTGQYLDYSRDGL